MTQPNRKRLKHIGAALVLLDEGHSPIIRSPVPIAVNQSIEKCPNCHCFPPQRLRWYLLTRKRPQPHGYVPTDAEGNLNAAKTLTTGLFELSTHLLQ
jgi:hypothetical protein